MTETVSLEPAPAGAARSGLAASALLLPALCAACLLVTFLIEGGVWGPVRDAGLTTDPGYSTALSGFVFAACSLVVLWRDPRQTFGWALAWVGLFWATDGVAESYLRLGLGRDEALPGMTFAAWYLLRFTALLPASVAVLLALFPTGRVLPGRWGVASWVSLGVMVAQGAVFVVLPSAGMPGVGDLPAGADPDPTSIHALRPITEELREVSLVAAVLAIVVVFASVVVRYRRSRGLERERMRWLVWAVLAMALLSGLSGVMRLGRLDAAVFFVVVVLAPLSMTVAVTRPRLVPIDDLLTRTVVYGSLSAVIVAVDLVVLAALSALVGASLGQRQVVLVVLLLSAILYNPLRVALWDFVRRLVLGQREDPYDVVARLASNLEHADQETEQLTAVAQAVARAFGIGFVSVEVERADGGRVVATYGAPVAETRALPITYRDEEVGRLVLPARGVRARLSGRDQRLLSDLVRQAATVSRTGRLAEELQENRQRLVVAREEERRRIHHDLHEDLGPTLGGLVHQVESARLLVAERPEEAKATIARTSAQLRDVVADVRRVVHDLRPPALDDLGLVGALRQQAALLDRDALRVTVRGDDLDALPAGVEVAAYRIASELLAHCAARESSCELVLESGPAGLAIEAGAAADPQPFLDVVRAQALEVGGRCATTADGLVRVTLPVRRPS